MKMVLKAAESSSVDICVSGVDERHWDQWLGDFADTYLGKMGELYEENRFNFRILIIVVYHQEILVLHLYMFLVRM